MAHRAWLLVEWVDERNVFPSYGVVNAESLVSNETALHPGMLTFVREKHGNSARRAQVLRICDHKRVAKEHKVLLERQDHQVKNVISMCMRTIKEMKSEPLYFGSANALQTVTGPSGSNEVPRASCKAEYNSTSDSDSSESSVNSRSSKISKHSTQSKRLASSIGNINGNTNLAVQATPLNTTQKRRSIVNSTPLPHNGGVTKLTFDQATQTDETEDDIQNLDKIEQMELILKRLYAQFLSLVGRLQLDECHESLSIDVSDAFPNDSDSERYEDRCDQVEESGEAKVANFQETEETERKPNAKTLQVRRVSAHTTNNVEQNQTIYNATDMVPLGAGNAIVPARLLNDINWDSYSTATRKLLQAIFPRRVLATHSLTGKQSPSFTNRPPKQCLDPKLVEDIINTVSERCGVPKRLVRSCITTKCTDEAKLFRNRQQSRSTRQQGSNQRQDNQETVPLSPLSSLESYNATD